MEGIEIVQKKLESENFSFDEILKWKNISYVCGDYYFNQTNKIIAKYIFLHVDIEGWKLIYSEENAFVTEVIEDIYYLLDKDIRWNLYLICVVKDEDLVHIDRYEKRRFEDNVMYTRNFLITESALAQRIPIGKVFINANQCKIQHPLIEWQVQLQQYDFCMNPLSEEALLETLLKGVNQKKQNYENKEQEKIQLEKISDIKIPKMFRPHLYKKDWILPCCNCNLLFGANGAGKTSILSAVELTITGNVNKSKKNLNDNTNQADIRLSILRGNEITTLRQPDEIQKEVRETEWYNYYEPQKRGSRLNALFHKFNYFSVDDSYRFASCSPEKEDIFSCLLYGDDTVEIWNNIQENRAKCLQIIRGLEQEYQNIKEQLHQPPPRVDKIYEDMIRRNISEMGLQISATASFAEVADIISDINSNLAEISEYKPIVDRTKAENRIQEIDSLIPSLNKQSIMLERKIKKYKSFQSSVNKFFLFRSKQNDGMKIENLKIQKEKKDDYKLTLQTEKDKMQKIIGFWEKISRHLINNISKMTGEELGEHCEIISGSIEQYNKFQCYLEKIKSLTEQQEKVTFQINIVKKLYDRLSKLSSPEEYAKCFVANYIKQISQIFINLHMPQEFTELRIEDGDIVGIRNEEVVPLCNMSTGQRKAIAISVLFQVHLSNPVAPKFLLLDEPMAMIDPLNSLLLMDFLRELVITHNRQLLVTTMDKNIAMLFRRKFSFLDKEFQVISFNRQSKGACQIVQRKYDQKQLISEIEL